MHKSTLIQLRMYRMRWFFTSPIQAGVRRLMVCLKVSKPHVLRWQKRWKIPSCYTLNHFAQQLVCGIRIHVSVYNIGWMNREFWIEFTTQISIFRFYEMKTKADCFPLRCCFCFASTKKKTWILFLHSLQVRC